MRDSGVRGRFAYGPAQGMPNDKPMDLADWARLKRDLAKDDMIGLGMCSRNVDAANTSRGAIDADMAKKEWGAARDLGLPITLHTNGSATSGCWPPTICSARTYSWCIRSISHPATSSCWPSMMCATAFRRSARPAVPARTQLSELLQAGVKVSISIDNVTADRCDCFACMKMLRGAQPSPYRRQIQPDQPRSWCRCRPSTPRSTWGSPTRPAR